MHKSAAFLCIFDLRKTVLVNKALEGESMNLKGNQIEINGNNYQEIDGWKNGHWNRAVTPLNKLLQESNLQVDYVTT